MKIALNMCKMQVETIEYNTLFIAQAGPFSIHHWSSQKSQTILMI